MVDFRFRDYLRNYRLSFARILVVGAVISLVFIADHFLKKDVSHEVAEAWNEACIHNVSVSACIDRIDEHHEACFDLAYTSMLLTFGQSRWQSFKLDRYEQCMERGYSEITKASRDTSEVVK